jgi:hypothetical protein
LTLSLLEKDNKNYAQRINANLERNTLTRGESEEFSW